MKLAEDAKINEEFLQVVFGYFSVIGAYGHGYLLLDDETKSYIGNPYKISRTDYLRQSYWADCFYNNFLVRPPFRLISKGGCPPVRAYCGKDEYFVGEDWKHGNVFVPAGSKIVKVNGMACESFMDYLRQSTWLRYAVATTGNINLIINELLVINEGENFKGWQIDFLLPDNTTVQSFVPAKKGFFSLPVNEFSDPAKGNCVCLELNNDVGYIRLKTFGGDVTKEREKIHSFLNRSSGKYRKIIIDIRNNRGGLAYFHDNFIQPFLEKPVIYKGLSGVTKKYSRDTSQEYKNFLKWPVVLNRTGFANTEVKAPAGFESSEWTFYEVTQEIQPANRYPFYGDIFILIDGMTASAADNYAHFVKGTKTATLVGQRTNGSVGEPFSPDIVKLPASGIIFRVEIDLALNQDGSFDELVGTEPDVELPCTFLPEAISKESLLNDEWIKEVIGQTKTPGVVSRQ
jgi:hypothetical protein